MPPTPPLTIDGDHLDTLFTRVSSPSSTLPEELKSFHQSVVSLVSEAQQKNNMETNVIPASTFKDLDSVIRFFGLDHIAGHEYYIFCPSQSLSLRLRLSYLPGSVIPALNVLQTTFTPKTVSTCRSPIDLLLSERLVHIHWRGAAFNNLAIRIELPITVRIYGDDGAISEAMDYVIGFGARRKAFTTVLVVVVIEGVDRLGGGVARLEC
ncbi:hypothetical protein EX30DRAFT_372641 [Ascodesmis nigricans]|uniref:Uncharacterized protein n=1 Tax=Ascodesmis nigricans TaxID=341454 RepID=A0A4S2MTN6_9PEZI|nr:hypothetical protein EX30DRAFT_372641 [Ascodesmis nigricans]